MTHDLDRVTVDAAAIAAVVRDAPDARVGCYDGWTVVELARHVVQIHHWVTGVVTSRAQERPRGGTSPDETNAAGLPVQLEETAGRLVEVLAAADPSDEVWTISLRDRDVAFWRRRMVLETALHRWDAEDAAGRDATVDDEVAAAGVAEALDVYMAQRLDGADVGGAGQHVTFAPDGAAPSTLRLRADGVTVVHGEVDPDAIVSGSPLDLWLLVTCRRGLDVVTVAGDLAAAELAVRAASLVPGPAG